MKKYLYKFIAFIIIQLLIVLVVHIVFSNSQLGRAQYLAASIDKRQLLSNPQEERIVLIGGSNLALGINSHLLKKVLGRNPINMGLSALMGHRFMTAVVEPYLKKGDVVVLSFEYEIFGMKMLNDLPTVIFAYNPNLILHLYSWEELKFVLDGFFPHLGRMIRLVSAEILNGKEAISHLGIYRRNGFNQYGDFVAHWKVDQPEKIRNGWPIYDEKRMDSIVDRINEFNDVCKKKGALLFYSYPAYPISHASKKPIGEAICQICIRLEKGITIPLLNQFEESLYDDELFYDSCYHLNEKGADRRTKDLANSLKVAIKKP